MRLDDTDKTFNRLTAVRDVGRTKQGRLWEYLCECGNVIVTLAKSVRCGQTKSCGCLRKEKLAIKGRKRSLPPAARPDPEKFLSRVDLLNRSQPTVCSNKFGPCLNWTGSKTAAGRGQMWLDGRWMRAYHVAWFLEYGYWPEYLCHACDNKACVNVDHLYEGDDAANGHDRRAKGQGGVLFDFPVPVERSVI